MRRGIDVETAIKIGGEETRRIAVDVGLAAAIVGVGVGVVVVEENARREVGGHPISDSAVASPAV